MTYESPPYRPPYSCPTCAGMLVFPNSGDLFFWCPNCQKHFNPRDIEGKRPRFKNNLVTASGAPLATQEPATTQPRFRTARQIADTTSEEPEHIVKGLLYRGCIHEIDAKVKAGKTTFEGFMVAAILNDETFIGFPTVHTKVVWLTEERETTVKAMLKRCGLVEADDLHLLCRYDVADLEWPAIVEAAHMYAEKIGAGVVIVDTLSRWAKIPGDDENSPGAAAAAMEPLEAVAAAGIAVVVVRHDRKAGGEIGDTARGSSAFSGASDVILNLRRANVEGHPNRRQLYGIGRFDDIPEQLVIELQEGKYIALGDSSSVEREEAKAKLLDHLPTADGAALTEAEVLERTGITRSTFMRARDELLGTRQIERISGVGATKRAYGYRLVTKSTVLIRHEAEQLINHPSEPHVPEWDVPISSVQGQGAEQLDDLESTVQPQYIEEQNTESSPREPCRGGCGKLMPEGQTCTECVIRDMAQRR